MHIPGEPDLLLSALAELAALGTDDDRATLVELRGRLAGQRLRVLVAGEAKRGKSTLVNALLGRPVLPTGVTPLTALPTTVRYGQDEGVTALWADGHAEDFPLSALDDLVTERGNPGNRRGLASVTVVVDAPVLARGAELVDAPGTGSVYAHNTAAAEAVMETMDAAVFVLTTDPPVSASERELMARVAGLSVTMFVVLNKADYLAGYGTETGGLLRSQGGGSGTTGAAAAGVAGPTGSSEFAEALEFTVRVASAVAGPQVRVYPLSARAALSGGERLTEELRAELDAVREAAAELLGLTLSVPGPGQRLAPDLRFFYLVAEQAGQTELLAGAVRTRLPGEAGRRRARAYLHREAAALVPQQIGRARADLQYRLAEATRKLVRSIGARYAESTFRLESALRTAALARESTAEAAARLDHELAAQQQALSHVLTLLGEATATQAASRQPAPPG